MKNYFFWQNILTNGLLILCVVIITFKAYYRWKTRDIFLLFIGSILIAIGGIYRLLFNLFYHPKFSYNTFTAIVSDNSIPLSWYIDAIIINLGMICIIFGFSIFMFKSRKNSHIEM
jgi:hypothetical protein